MSGDFCTMGLDIGTGGARALIADATGRVLATGQRDLAASATQVATDRHEQDAHAWWDAAAGAIADVVRHLRESGREPAALKAIALDGTSGTLLPLDKTGEPVSRAIMYNDGRAAAEAAELNERFSDFCDRLGYRFAASFALPKALWLARHTPELWQTTAQLVHQADYIAARLAGRPVSTDYSNALKTGYDLIEQRWPQWMDTDAPLAAIRERLPEVVAPGAPIGEVSSAAAQATGLPKGVPILAGVTDGTAGFFASGAAATGETNTTLGTTLVFKRIAESLCTDPHGMVYSHKLPGDRWLPGAASSTGGEWIRQDPDFASADLAALDREAQRRLPCDCLMYPLARRGERFPFKSAEAVGFCEPASHDTAMRYAAGLQGVALLERLCYDVLDSVAGQQGEHAGAVYATGGGSASDIWMQLRADVTGRVMHRPATPEAAFGMAVLAASQAWGGLTDAIRRMVRIERTFEPGAAHKAQYDALYARFCVLLRERGYLTHSCASTDAPS